jgi:hypothetical protein
MLAFVFQHTAKRVTVCVQKEDKRRVHPSSRSVSGAPWLAILLTAAACAAAAAAAHLNPTDLNNLFSTSFFKLSKMHTNYQNGLKVPHDSYDIRFQPCQVGFDSKFYKFENQNFISWDFRPSTARPSASQTPAVL